MTAESSPQIPADAPARQSPSRTSGLAITSLVFGIASFLFWVIGSLAAIVFGHVARYKIKKSGGEITGKGMALAGIICGYATLCIAGMVVFLIFYNIHTKKHQIAEEGKRGKALYELVLKYETDHGQFPDRLSTLVSEGYIDSIDHLQPIRGGNWIYFQGLSSKSDSGKYFIRS